MKKACRRGLGSLVYTLAAGLFDEPDTALVDQPSAGLKPRKQPVSLPRENGSPRPEKPLARRDSWQAGRAGETRLPGTPRRGA